MTQALTETEQRNLRTVEGVHPSWNRGDVEGVLAYYDDDMEGGFGHGRLQDLQGVADGRQRISQLVSQHG